MNHRISCADMLLRLDDFVDRALSPEDVELVEEHLTGCVKCGRSSASSLHWSNPCVTA